MKSKLFKSLFHFGHDRGGSPLQNIVPFAESGIARLRRLAVKVLQRHRCYTAHEVAQIVGQIRIDALNQTFLAEARIESEYHVSHQEIAEGIEAVLVLQVERTHDIAQALGHFALFDIPVAVNIEVLIRFDPGRLEHRRPVDAVGFHDILGD
ncbi:MAG: hypothetical protein BWY44_00104 [Candidatus Omnitrophica bacterium ADurb.Bin292]|nr:MAG: hypothetical protein BWY44_00104 [Candidatus Omnitrophica bacterium ADurb.Bin292]